MSGIRAYIGRCGSGKTFKLQQDLAHAFRTAPKWRFLVLDVNREIGEAKGLPAFAGSPRVTITKCSSINAAREAFAKGARLVVVRPDRKAVKWGTPAPYAPIANACADLALEVPPCILVLPEVHQSCKEGYALPPTIEMLAHTWRHLDVHVWADTQNIAHVKKELLKACDVIYVFATGSPQDRKALEAYGGREFSEAVLEMAGHVARTKEAGWHVRLDTAQPVPPFTAMRFTKGELSRMPLGRAGEVRERMAHAEQKRRIGHKNKARK